MNDVERRLGRLSLEDKIGQMLIVGFGAGAEGEQALRRVVDETRAGNIILFARNAGDAGAAACSVRFSRDLVEGATGIRPLVAVDQEGGIVARISRGITPLPGAMALAAGSSPDEVRALCAAVARDLASLGIDWNLGPVADVNVNPANPVIGVRSFGEDPRRVAEYALAWFEGMRAGGVLSCAKHFPGHGDTSVDSHLDLPEIPHSMLRLEAVELVPFVALIAAGIPAILTAHVRFPAVEGGSLPATLSSAVIGGLLRERMGFGGLVVTDCMEMKAIANHFPDAAVMAVEAGADMIMVSHSAALQIEAARSILAAVTSERISESRIDSALRRILAMKTEAAEIGGTSAVAISGSDPLGLATLLSARSLSPANEVVFPDISRGGFYIDIIPAGFSLGEDLLPGHLPAAGPILSALNGDAWAGCTLPIRPRDSQAADCLSRVDGFLAERPGRPLVFGLHNASTDPTQRELAAETRRRCLAAGSPFACVATRSPYDSRLFPGAACVCAYEYTAISSRSIADFLGGKIPAAGRPPVTLRAEF